MSKYKIGDMVYGCYQRSGCPTETISAIVTEILDQDFITIVFGTPYNREDIATVHENLVRSVPSCHNCIHRLTHLSSGGYCEGSYRSL